MLIKQYILELIERYDEHEEAIRKIVEMVREKRAHLPVLLELLQNADNWLVRYRIAIALGQLGIYSEDVAEALISRIRVDNDKYVRREATESLVKVSPRGAEAIIPLLNDDDMRTIECVSEVVAEIGERRALPALVSAVRRQPSSCMQSLIRLAGERAPHYVLAAFRGTPLSLRRDFINELFNIFSRYENFSPNILRHFWWHLSAR
jgi:HEAT repeat protein